METERAEGFPSTIIVNVVWSDHRKRSSSSWSIDSGPRRRKVAVHFSPFHHFFNISPNQKICCLQSVGVVLYLSGKFYHFLRTLYREDWDSHFSLNYYTEVHDSMCCLAPHFRLSSQLSRSLGRPFDIRDRAEIASHDCVAKDDTLTKMVVPTF